MLVFIVVLDSYDAAELFLTEDVEFDWVLFVGLTWFVWFIYVTMVLFDAIFVTGGAGVV